MKILLTVLLVVSSVSWAQSNPTSETATDSSKNVQELVKTGKKERRKKVEMCHECGKPEAECTCKGEGHKKSEN